MEDSCKRCGHGHSKHGYNGSCTVFNCACSWFEPLLSSFNKEEPHSIPLCNGRFMVAIYEISRHYGGPEEGGWWYDSGDLVRLVCVSKNEHDAYKKAGRMQHLWHLFNDKRKNYRNRYSMAYSGGDYQFMVYTGLPPMHFPEVRPHYE